MSQPQLSSNDILSRFGAKQSANDETDIPDLSQLRAPTFFKSPSKRKRPFNHNVTSNPGAPNDQRSKNTMSLDVSPSFDTQSDDHYDSERVRFDSFKTISALDSRTKRILAPDDLACPSKETILRNKILSSSGPFYPLDDFDVRKELAKTIGFEPSEIKLQQSEQPMLCGRSGSSNSSSLSSFTASVQKIVGVPRDETLDVIGRFTAISDSLVDQKYADMTGIWKLLKYLVNKLHSLDYLDSPVPIVPRGYFRESYNAQFSASSGAQAKKFRISLKSASISFLGDKYDEYIDSVTPLPYDDLHAKIDAFIQKEHNCIESFWAHVYYLFRCNHITELMNYLADNRPKILKGDCFLIDRIEKMLRNPNERVTEEEQHVILKEIRHQERVANGKSIRFHLLLLKLVGCIDPKNDEIQGASETFEDTLWFQLHAVREPSSTTEEGADASTSTLDTSNESYDPNRDLDFLSSQPNITSQGDTKTWCLESLRRLVIAIGPGSSFFVHSLLLTGQFEAAVNHLSFIDNASALHLAIALEYYGLLRTAKKPKFLFLGEVFSCSSKKAHIVSEIQFDALLASTLGEIAPTHAPIALPYIFLLGLLPHPAYKNVCQLFIERFVIDTKQYDVLLGCILPNARIQAGLLAKFKHLIRAPNFDEFYYKTCRKAALNELIAGNLTAAERLLSLTKDHLSCVKVISKQLADILYPFSLSLAPSLKDELDKASWPRVSQLKSRLLWHIGILGSNDDCPVQLSTSIVLEMLDFCRAYLFEDIDAGRIAVQNLYIIPASSSPKDLAEKLDQLSRLNTWVKLCIPSVFAVALQFIKKAVDFPAIISTDSQDLDLVRLARNISLLVAEDLKHTLLPASAISSIQSDTFFEQYDL